MNANQFANEFINDLIEDFNNSNKEYSFNDAIYNDDKDLQVLKTKLKKFGLYLEKTSTDTYKIKFDKSLLFNTMCEFVTNHTTPAKNTLIFNAQNENASKQVLNLIETSYKNCQMQIIDDIKDLD